MAAVDNLQPQQLRMFMTAREILTEYKPHEGDRLRVGAELESDEELWDRKADELEDVYADSIMQHGVKHPVHLGVDRQQFTRQGDPVADPRSPVVGGHHRIAFMHQVAPDELMPVLHHRNILDAKSDGQHWARTREGFGYR